MNPKTHKKSKRALVIATSLLLFGIMMIPPASAHPGVLLVTDLTEVGGERCYIYEGHGEIHYWQETNGVLVNGDPLGTGTTNHELDDLDKETGLWQEVFGQPWWPWWKENTDTGLHRSLTDFHGNPILNEDGEPITETDTRLEDVFEFIDVCLSL